jgi:hypothetical protein
MDIYEANLDGPYPISASTVSWRTRGESGSQSDGLLLMLNRERDIDAYDWRTHGPASETAGFILLHLSAAMRGCEYELPGIKSQAYRTALFYAVPVS